MAPIDEQVPVPNGIVREEDVGIEVKNDFLDYAMSVIVSRALPDVRDGLKPVHRRVLFSMHDQNMTHNSASKKSARIVGDVIGKYHPHGDTAVYETMVRMSQPWNLRTPLIEGQGNFGSMSGDNAAAMRYTEARMQKITEELMRGIDKQAVAFKDNYDKTEKEPVVLPARFPNLLVNGSSGIAVGMATNIPPHNLKEVCHAVIAQLEDPAITLDGLMEHIKGPDFPTGAEIRGVEPIRTAYETGRGSIVLRAKTHVEESDGYQQLIITQVPYQTNLSTLISKIKEVQELYDDWLNDASKKGIKKPTKALNFHIQDGVIDETDKRSNESNLRIVVTLKRHVTPEIVLNHLYKYTPLQTTFSFNNLALVPDKKGMMKPKLLGLKNIIEHYIRHQIEIVRNETQYDLAKAKDRTVNINALIKALDHLDAVIDIIKTNTYNEAKMLLGRLLSVEEEQAAFIMSRQIRSLTSGDQAKFREEQQELFAYIASLEEILSQEEKVKTIIKEDLTRIAEDYGNDRITELLPPAKDITMEDLIQNHKTVITITQKGYIKSTNESTYRAQRRNGRGVSGMGLNEDDFVRHLEVVHKHDSLLFFTNLGKVYTLKGYEIPDSSRNAKGTPLVNLLMNLEKNESIQVMMAIQEFTPDQHLLFATQNGIVKKTRLSEYANIRRTGIHAIKLDSMDAVVSVNLTDGTKPVTLVTRMGQSITFEEKEVKITGRFSRGVKGISLQSHDRVVSSDIHEAYGELFLATNDGYGKRTPLNQFRIQSRGGKGVRAIRTKETSFVIGAVIVVESDTMMLITTKGAVIKLACHHISTYSRNAQGTKLMNVREEDQLSTLARTPDDYDQSDEENEPTE